MLLLGCPWEQCPNIKKQILSTSKETKWWMELPEGFACPIPPQWSQFVGRRRVIPSHLANRFGSWFGTNKKLLRGVSGPAYNIVFCLCVSCRFSRFSMIQRNPVNVNQFEGDSKLQLTRYCWSGLSLFSNVTSFPIKLCSSTKSSGSSFVKQRTKKVMHFFKWTLPWVL